MVHLLRMMHINLERKSPPKFVFALEICRLFQEIWASVEFEGLDDAFCEGSKVLTVVLLEQSRRSGGRLGTHHKERQTQSVPGNHSLRRRRHLPP